MWTKIMNKLDKMVVPEKYIISYKNKKKENWDYFVLVLAFQNSLNIPIDLAF